MHGIFGGSVHGERQAARNGLDAAITRVAADAGAPATDLVILRDAGENYSAWLAAIRCAQHSVLFENFIIAHDETGRTFAAALIERARAGVRVRLLYDWLGTCARASRGYFAALTEAGVEVRAFGRPRLSRPHLLARDHRKLLVVDDAHGFVAGLCVSDHWTGRRGDEPWRDTGIAFGGPAVAVLRSSFAEMWMRASGLDPRPGYLPVAPVAPIEPGETRVRVVQGRPGERRLYRVDMLAAATARERLWLTDAYFLPTRSYVEALSEAARDGVDVRLLVPGRSDVPLLPAFVRTGYRPLLEAGVRIYEWSGAMLHAKTAVVDGRLSRIGSTNLNPASFFGNYELDVVIDDADFGVSMEAMFLADLDRADEIVSFGHNGASPLPHHVPARIPSRPPDVRWRPLIFGLGQTLTGTISQRRSLSRLERSSAGVLIGLLLAFTLGLSLFPGIFVFPMAASLMWIALSLALRLWKERSRIRLEETAASQSAGLPNASVLYATRQNGHSGRREGRSGG